MNVNGVVGCKNAGKSTLARRLVAGISRRVLAVPTSGHAHRRPGDDRRWTDRGSSATVPGLPGVTIRAVRRRPGGSVT